MQKRFIMAIVLSFILCGLGASSGLAGNESLAGKWQGKAETPQGLLELVFTFRQDGDRLQGSTFVFDHDIPLSAIKFDDPKLSMNLIVREETYQLVATLREGKLEGTWEQVGGDVKGTWSAVRNAGGPETPSSGISGLWNSVAVTSDRELAATLELKSEGGKVSGTLGNDQGSLPIQAVTFSDNKLQFDLELGGNVYRVQGTYDGTKFEGNWKPVAGGEGGAWKATRKAAAALASTASATPAILGQWDVVAAGPEGNLPFTAEFKKDGDALKGAIVSPDGSLPLQKVSFEGDKLVFEVEYMGGKYRIEATVDNDKITGKWSAVDGSDSGSITGGRKKI